MPKRRSLRHADVCGNLPAGARQSHASTTPNLIRMPITIGGLCHLSKKNRATKSHHLSTRPSVILRVLNRELTLLLKN
jgi:hypothetical protein